MSVEATSMTSVVELLTLGIVVFASTNVDDIFLLSAFFADPHLMTRNVVAGQFLGIAALVLASTVAALAALAVPPGWTALLGVVPLALGLVKLRQLRTTSRAEDDAEDAGDSKEQEHRLEDRTHSQILAVAGVTVANGGDNLGVYIPLLASNPRAIPVDVVIFAVMTAMWCAAGYALVNNPMAGGYVRRYGHLLLPFVLIALGAYILSDAMVLLD
jgi:cadmium resistance protein CadD (predicted permease)